MKSIIINLFTAAVLAFALISCADLQDDVVVDPNKNEVNVHSKGILNPEAPDFHGKFFPKSDLDECRDCHASSLTGGPAEVGCIQCHNASVQLHKEGILAHESTDFHGKFFPEFNLTDCKDCHRNDLTGGPVETGCVQCHTTGIQVHKSGILTPESPNYHAKFFLGNYAALANCKSCHYNETAGRYTGSEASPSCGDAECHSSSTGRGPEGCSTCHSTSRSMDPWKDLAGNTEKSHPGVGAHKVHLTGGTLGVKVEDCYTCHKELEDGVFSEGHLDNSDGAELVWSALAVKTTDVNNIKPAPVYANNSCSNTYCHGYFKNGNLSNTVSWTALNGSDEVKCGSCHGDVTTGNPLPKGNHVKVAECENCHADVVEKSGDQYVIKDVTKHMNGKLNVFGQETDF